MKPLQVAIIGMGGFAGAHHDAIAGMEAAGEVKLVCICDPAMEKFGERQQALRFAARGVRLFSEYREMLDACRAELDFVIVPTPIPLHAPMHRACVERGLAVYLEKPPTLDHAELARVEAELYRAHPIEGMDTAFVRAQSRDGVELRIGMPHACHGRQTQEECVVCERAAIRYHINHSGPPGRLYSVTWNDGRRETAPEGHPGADLLPRNLQAYAAYLRGQAPRPVTRLADCRPFVQINNLAYIAAGKIATIPAACVQPEADGFLRVAGLPEAVGRFIDSGEFPTAQALPWGVPGGAATPADLGKLEETIRRMAG